MWQAQVFCTRSRNLCALPAVFSSIATTATMARSPFSNTLPDFALTGPEVAAKGYGGLLAAGFFDHAWRVAPAAAFFAADCVPSDSRTST